MIPNVLPEGRLNRFLNNWQLITVNAVILNYAGYKIPLLKNPLQSFRPPSVQMTEQEKITVQRENAGRENNSLNWT